MKTDACLFLSIDIAVLLLSLGQNATEIVSRGKAPVVQEAPCGEGRVVRMAGSFLVTGSVSRSKGGWKRHWRTTMAEHGADPNARYTVIPLPKGPVLDGALIQSTTFPEVYQHAQLAAAFALLATTPHCKVLASAYDRGLVLQFPRRSAGLIDTLTRKVSSHAAAFLSRLYAWAIGDTRIGDIGSPLIKANVALVSEYEGYMRDLWWATFAADGTLFVKGSPDFVRRVASLLCGSNVTLVTDVWIDGLPVHTRIDAWAIEKLFRGAA